MREKGNQRRPKPLRITAWIIRLNQAIRSRSTSLPLFGINLIPGSAPQVEKHDNIISTASRAQPEDKMLEDYLM